MNLILVEPGEVDAQGRVRLTGRRARHVREVLGAGVGDTLRVGVVRGQTGSAQVAALGDDSAELDVVLSGGPAERPAVDVVLALPRPKALLRALETCASFGVDRIDLVNAWRVDKSYFQSSRVTPVALRDALTLGCEQGQTAWLPSCSVHRLLVPFVNEELAPRLAEEQAAARLIAHPRAERAIEQVCDRGNTGRVVIAIGPERGWIDRELDMFERHGFSPVRLGAPVLRTEAALAALLAQLALLARLD